jgi:hypothetical protein
MSGPPRVTWKPRGSSAGRRSASVRTRMLPMAADAKVIAFQSRD